MGLAIFSHPRLASLYKYITYIHICIVRLSQNSLWTRLSFLLYEILANVFNGEAAVLLAYPDGIQENSHPKSCLYCIINLKESFWHEHMVYRLYFLSYRKVIKLYLLKKLLEPYSHITYPTRICGFM